ncbi:unnamed protein product, partial [Oppiella nova]
MHTNNRFGKLVFYLEACESGSMFEKLLPDNINVYAMTSTNSTELGWNCCRDTVRGAWVSSYFGYYWYKNWQSSDFLTETLQDQFEYLHNTTNQTGVMERDQHPQHAHQWGDLSITKLPVSQFQVNTRDLPVRMLEMNIEETDDINEKLRYEHELKQLLNGRKYMDKHMAQYVSTLGANLDEITSLPGLSKPIKFKQYSGYLNASKGRHHFYWFVESETDPASAPVVLWLTGGPACSSLFAMMTENGPFSANEDGVTLSSREHAWNTVANMVFMESPVSTG